MEGITRSQIKALELAEQEKDTEENCPEKAHFINCFGNFLKKFPTEKNKIEDCIRRIRQEADEIDKTHKNCTIVSTISSSARATSGVLTILGLVLAPVTVGGTLILTVAGTGLGAAASVTDISTSISEDIIKSQKNEKAQNLIEKCQEKLNMVMGQIDCNSGLRPNNNHIQEIIQNFGLVIKKKVPNLVKAVKEITSNVKALQRATGNAALKALAKQAAGSGSTARAGLKEIDVVDKAFKGTPLAMSKGIRVLGATTAGVGLILDASSIVRDSIHLAKGAKTETASEIRNRASELEETLNKLNKLYEELRNLI